MYCDPYLLLVISLSHNKNDRKRTTFSRLPMVSKFKFSSSAGGGELSGEMHTYISTDKTYDRCSSTLSSRGSIHHYQTNTCFFYNTFDPNLTIFIVNIMSDTSSAATTISVTPIDTSLICIAHCPFQKGRAFGLSNVKQCRVSKKPCSIYGHLQTWHRFQTPACRIIIDAIKKQLPTSTNINLDEVTAFFPGEVPNGKRADESSLSNVSSFSANHQAQSTTTQQFSSTLNHGAPLATSNNNNNNSYGGSQDLAALVALITNPIIMLTQQMQQQQQSLDQLQQMLANQIQSRIDSTTGKFLLMIFDKDQAKTNFV